MQEDDIEFIVRQMNKSYEDEQKQYDPTDVKDKLTEKEAIKIYNELLNVLSNHNLSYRCACDVSISLMYALLSGDAELYQRDLDEP